MFVCLVLASRNETEMKELMSVRSVWENLKLLLGIL